MKKLIFILCALVMTGCATTNVSKKDFSAFETAAPRSILIVPTVNHSLDVDAPNYVLSTLPVPLAEKGYYVFPVNTTKVVLEQEGLYEGDLVQRQKPEVLAKLFGADAILYVTINRWDAQYAVIVTTVTVDFDYRMVSKEGVEIFKENKKLQYSPQNNASGSPLAQLISAAINAAVARAKPNYMPLTRMANNDVFVTGKNPIPDGPYKAISNK
ncbi:DUF799 domain-containing protein [Undibacterium sp. RuRC25W]|uniref:DUF799 domain-containing protein n=1 Tax=Undibacterium sp. RuRC25W TaxID=3413047 RepID=UPI003BF2D945